MVDFVHAVWVVVHQCWGVGGAEEVPVLPLGVAEDFRRAGVLAVEGERLWRGDFVGAGEEGKANAAFAVVEVEAGGDGWGLMLVNCAGAVWEIRRHTGAPVMSNGYHIVRHAFSIQNLGYGIGLSAIVVLVRYFGFGRVSEA